MSQETYEYSAGGVVIKDDLILLIEHARGEWIMPKGHLEAEETTEEAARREITEETGLDCVLGPELAVTRYDFDRGGTVVHKQVTWYLATAPAKSGEGRPQTSEGIVRIAWLAPREALERLTFALDRTVLHKALERVGLELK